MGPNQTPVNRRFGSGEGGEAKRLTDEKGDVERLGSSGKEGERNTFGNRFEKGLAAHELARRGKKKKKRCLEGAKGSSWREKVNIELRGETADEKKRKIC